MVWGGYTDMFGCCKRQEDIEKEVRRKEDVETVEDKDISEEVGAIS